MSELIPLLNVEDVSASLAFYRTALGAVVRNQWELEGSVQWALVDFEGGKLMLNTPDGASSVERRGRREFADAVLYLMCDDARARREQLQAAGIEVGEITHEEYGNLEFAVRDPDGYALRFSSVAPKE